jgi:hypothetical protein
MATHLFVRFWFVVTPIKKLGAKRAQMVAKKAPAYNAKMRDFSLIHFNC